MLGERQRQGIDPGLDAALDAGYTLPAAWYTEPTWFAREQEQIFRRTWQYVGLAEQIAAPGSFFTAQIGTVPPSSRATRVVQCAPS